MTGVITKLGKNLLFQRIIGSTQTTISKFKTGISSTTPTTADTGLGKAVPINGTEQVDSCDATTGWTASGTNSVSQNTTLYLEGTAALNLVKSDITSANCSCSKTTTSRDFTSKDFWVFIYISASTLAKLATTNCLEIRFGSDASAYYYKRYNAANLAAGWNDLTFNTSTATGTTGSPAIASCDYSFVQFTTANATDTSTAGNFVIDDLKVASADDYLKSLSSGYPTLDTGTVQMTSRAVIASTDAIGFPICEAGLFNNDGTPILFSHDTFTPAIQKTDTIEVIYEWVDFLA